jgi:hypothetical protein
MKLGETLMEAASRLIAENRPQSTRPAAGLPVPAITTGRRTMAINVPPGVPPPTAGITSRDDGSDLDHVRTAILALQIYAEQR